MAADIEQLKRALVNADKAGDTAAATALAAEIRKMQAPQEPPAQQELGVMDRVADMFTGNLRETEQTRTLPDYAEMPEMNDIFSMGGWKTGLGTLLAGPEESAKIIQANNPGVQVKQDARGNMLLFSPKAQQWYAIRPGMTINDIVRGGAGVGAGILGGAPIVGAAEGLGVAGLTGTVLTGAAAGAAPQTAIEASQAATGGDFNANEVGLAGVMGGAVPLAGAGLGAARRAVSPTPMAKPPIPTSQAPAPAAAAAKPTEVESEKFGSLVRTAAKGGMGSTKAKEELARLAAINPEAKAAAEKLGMDLPADVISDARLLQESVGLSRAVKASEASTTWAQTVTKAREKADEAIMAIDASPDIATVSETVKQSLGKTREDLKSAAKAIYDGVDEKIPKPTKVDMPSVAKTISALVDEVGEENLSAAERRLYKLATDPGTTYGALLREKAQIGKALERADAANPYGSVETGALKRLYAAVAEDQLSAVGSVAGNEAANNLKYANQLVATRKGLEDRIVNAFGKEGEGSIATKLTAAIKTGAKGDITQLNKMIDLVPKELRKETLASAMMAQARTPRGDFSFGAYESMYQGLRKNAPVYASLAKELGPEAEETMRALYVVSKRINASEAMIPKTGLGNQAILNKITADGFIRSILSSRPGKIAAVSAGTAGGGGIGGGLASVALDALANNKKDLLAASNKLLTSPDFTQLAADIAERGAEKAASKAAVRKLAISPAFAAWANRAGIPNGIRVREDWIRSSILSASNISGSGDKNAPAD